MTSKKKFTTKEVGLWAGQQGTIHFLTINYKGKRIGTFTNYDDGRLACKLLNEYVK